MTTEEYLQVVASEMPKDHMSQEWLDWLISRNIATYTNFNYWIMIQNIKYHKPPMNKHYTLFIKGEKFGQKEKLELFRIRSIYPDYSLYENGQVWQTIKRPHFHLVDKGISELIEKEINFIQKQP